MKIASVEVLQAGCELTGQHTFVRLTTDSGVSWAWPVRRLRLPAGRRWRARGADPASHRFRPLSDRASLASLLPSAALPRQPPLGCGFGDRPRPLGHQGQSAASYRSGSCSAAEPGTRCGCTPLSAAALRTRSCSSVNWAVDEGFTAVKFDPLVHGYEDFSMSRLVSSACSMAAAAREAGGNEIDLIFELHRKLDPTKAIVVCNALAQYHPLFIEDPIQIDSIETQAEICKRIDSPIATGRAAELDLGVQRASLPPRLDSRAAGCRPCWRPLRMSQDRGDRRGAPLRGRAPQLPRPRTHGSDASPLHHHPEPRDHGVPSPRRGQDIGLCCYRNDSRAQRRLLRDPGGAGPWHQSRRGLRNVAPVDERPFSDEGLLRADGSVAAAN